MPTVLRVLTIENLKDWLLLLGVEVEEGLSQGWLDLNISEQRCGCGSNIMVVFLGIILTSYRLCIIYESYQLFCMLGFEPRT